ncbi:MAG TPA: abortive infection family protein [Actinomycetes bacterium]|nr:abortive infection family protein [Actinomycetes bacterium]
MRNQYGPDHGRTQVTVLSPRHAHLAVGCASTYSRLLLETLADPDAPWRRAAASP